MASFTTKSLVFALSSLAAGVLAAPCPSHCPAFNGTFDVHQYQLYPENADWDTKRCVVYFGAVFNASVAVFDPYAGTVDTIAFPGVTHNPKLHLGGVGVDRAGLLSALASSVNAIITGGADVSGDYVLYKVDPETRAVLWSANITAVTGGRYGGFQDVEHDARGYTYVVGTYPGTIVRVAPGGAAVVPWYLPAAINTTQMGFGGLAAVGDVLLANDNLSGKLLRFDMRADVGVPVPVVTTPANASIAGSDAIYFPPRYNGTVLLVAEDGVGAAVLRSKDQWVTAEYLGLIQNNAPSAQGGLLPAVVQVGPTDTYMVEAFFADPVVAGTTAGNRTEFPMVDITAQIEALLS